MWTQWKKPFAITLTVLGATAGLSGCGYVDKYEEQVYDREPVYCYKSLAATQCFNEPNHRDQRRLVNYFGPHPSRYDPPPAQPEPELQAPPAIDYWVKDAEPIPRPAPSGDLADRPWLSNGPHQARPLLSAITPTRATVSAPTSPAAAPKPMVASEDQGGIAALMRLINRGATRDAPTATVTGIPAQSAQQPVPAGQPAAPVASELTSKNASL